MHNVVNVLNATIKLYTLKWLIIDNVNFASVKKRKYDCEFPGNGNNKGNMINYAVITSAKGKASSPYMGNRDSSVREKDIP